MTGLLHLAHGVISYHCVFFLLLLVVLLYSFPQKSNIICFQAYGNHK